MSCLLYMKYIVEIEINAYKNRRENQAAAASLVTRGGESADVGQVSPITLIEG